MHKENRESLGSVHKKYERRVIIAIGGFILYIYVCEIFLIDMYANLNVRHINNNKYEDK